MSPPKYGPGQGKEEFTLRWTIEERFSEVADEIRAMEWADWSLDHAPGEGARDGQGGSGCCGGEQRAAYRHRTQPSQVGYGGPQGCLCSAAGSGAQEWAELSLHNLRVPCRTRAKCRRP